MQKFWSNRGENLMANLIVSTGSKNGKKRNNCMNLVLLVRLLQNYVRAHTIEEEHYPTEF